MPRRDPHTGQFVSGGGSGGDGWDKVAGNLMAEIPAADLAGGTSTGNESNTVDGELATVIDFSSILEHEEMFDVEWLYLDTVLYAPTTATAEGTVWAEWELSRESTMSVQHASNPFINGAVKGEDGLLDVGQSQAEESSLLASGQMVGTPSFGDSTNGLGAGSDVDRTRQQFPVFESFDEDDEIYFPVELSADNVSDHAVAFDTTVVAYGKERDTC